MKRILIVRYPSTISLEKLKESCETTQRIMGNEWVVLPFAGEVEKVEVEIVYDPHLSQDAPRVVGGEGSLSWRHNA